MAMPIVYAAIKVLIFLLVVTSGLMLIAGHTADEVTRWKYWGGAAVIWAVIVALANIE